MRRQLISKCTALLLAAWLLLGLTMPAAWAAEGEIAISSVEELAAFSKSCSLDTWSQGKTVRLTADLDLSGTDFSPIPTFGGTFLGDGHTISGLRLTAGGSRQGLFRQVQTGAVVADLHVTGSVAPGGSRSQVGGIAGVNGGTIRNCSFRGTVKGDTAVGGIVGENRETGQVSGCSVSGIILGQSGTGGVAGRNLGILLKCSSAAGVNTTENADAPSQLDPDAAIEQLTNQDEDTDPILNNHTDTGGVVGYSSGVVQSCTNTGAVGYPHVGYNVGGVAGRQTGYLSGCVNSGTVYGRKDVGGIAGQAEPYVALNPGSDALRRLRTELDTLETLIDRALDGADATNADISARLSDMGRSTDSARESSKLLLDHTADFIDGNVESLNALSVSVTNALDQMDPALGKLEDSAGWLGKLTGHLQDALEGLELTEEERASFQAAIDDLHTASGGLSDAAGDLKDAVKALIDALVRGDDGAAEEALDRMNAAAADLGGAVGDAGDAIGGIPDLPDTGGDWSRLREALERLADALGRVDWEQAKKAGEALGDALTAAGELGEAALALLKALDDALVESGRADGTLKDLRDAAASAAGMSRALDRAFSILSDAARDLAEAGPIEFATLGEETRAAGEDLYGSLADLSQNMEALNTAVQSGGERLSADLRAVSHQFNTVFGVLLDALEALQNGESTDKAELIEDTSDENIAATRLGKVADSRSTGTVEGDRNVGGVVGAMAIEYGLDPEDDAARLPFGSTYETKAVLQGCLNRGAVTAKKDCAGGLVGRMDLGTAVDCQNYGAVESTNGNYTGGVVGQSSGSVRNCYAKCTLSGNDYVGGIAGWADRLTDSCAIATITGGTEYLGAVAGDADLEGGIIRNNCFVDTGVAAIDGVSYAGKAAPAAFGELRARPGIPTEFVSFTLTLTADGETVAQIPFFYGDDLSLIDLPAVPTREDAYGVWPAFDTSGLESDITLEAVYTPWVTLVDSTEKSGKLSLALAGGRFTQDAELHVTESTAAGPEEGASVWEVTLTGTDLTGGDTVPLRLLNEGGGRAKVWQRVNGSWRQVDADRNGQYLMLTMLGTSGTFCVCADSGGLLPVSLLLAAAALLALTAVLLLRKRHKKKNAAGKKELSESRN